MSCLSPTHGRRAEPRTPAISRRLAWSRAGAAMTATGWVKDISPFGIAFVTRTQDRPAPGEAIDLTIGSATPSPRYRRVRVARTAPFDRFFSLVGCTADPEDKSTRLTEPM